jgi:hypothetical protein
MSSALPPGGGQQHRLRLAHLSGKTPPIYERVNCTARTHQFAHQDDLSRA